MRGLRGFLVGVLGLSALQVIVSTPASGYLGEIAQAPGRWLRDFVDPTKPLIPDVRNAKTKSIQSNLEQAYAAASYGPPPSTVPAPRAATPPPLTA